MSLKTKTIVGILLGVYFFSHSFTQWIFGFGAPVYAADEIQEQIIAVFVDKAIYDRHSEDINRYAQSYLQSRSSATKALLMPIDKDHFQAQDIRKMLENLYQEGIKEKKSALVGTILIGEIPLPVINENTYIYPSIYPYTDLEKPTYLHDENSTYFVPQEKGDHKADIWQSVINFEQRDGEYSKFFGKLRTYQKDPTGYASTKIWYDDFIGLKKYFADQFLSGYINNFLFHEDITYHRFTNLILDYFKDGANANAVALISDYTANVAMSTDDDYSELGEVEDEYKNAISKWKSDLNTMTKNASKDLNEIGDDSDKIPTLMIGQALSSLIKPYTDLFAPEFLTNISSNISAGGRRTDADVDGHLKKTVLKDNLTSPVLLDANTLMEDALYTKLKTDNYALHIPIALVYEEYECTPLPPRPLKRIKGRFENFYFGKSAFDISSTQDISIYPGTRKNISSRQSLTSYDYTTPANQQDDIAIDYTARSIGSSYGIASRQVEASRGYNTLLVPSDEEHYNARKCSKSQSLDDFVGKYRGGISPLNVDGNTMQLKQNNPKMAWNPRFDTSIGGPVYDVAGSKITLTKMNEDLFFLNEMNNSMLHRTQHFRIAPWIVCGQIVPPGEVNENRYNGYPHMDGKDAEYFSTYNAGENVYLTNNNTNTSAQQCGKNYVYKTIDTLETHSSPTPEQIKAMTPLTPDRPIDSARFVGFKGIGGGTVTFDYPNIYNVSVYKKTGTILSLMSPAEITESIKTYLKEKVSSMNAKLSAENTKASAYYTANGKAYDNLSSVDTLATPKGRTYALLPESFFIDALGNATIESVANILYRQNLGRSNKPASTDLMTDLKNNQASLDINNKIGYVVANYLTKTDTPSAAIVPGYEPKGYELAYINSDGNDIIKTTVTPTIVDSIIQKKLSTTEHAITSSDAANAGLDLVDKEQKDKCGIEKNATVPLLKWPAALVCWMKSLKEMALKDVVKINFKNAQGPVLSLDQFKETFTVWSDSFQNYSEQRNGILGKNAKNNTTNTNGAALSADAQTLVRALDETLTIKLNKSALSLDEKDMTLTLSANYNVGNLSVRISGTGENCPVLEGKNICNSEYAFASNLYTSPRTVPVTLANNKLGSSIVNVKVCQNVRCTQQQLIVPITAGAMTNVAIVTPTDKALYGSQIPIALTASDAHGNPIEQTITTYRLSPSAGTIIANGNATTGLDLQEFSPNENYYLDLSNVPTSTQNVTLRLEPLNADSSSVAPRATKTLSLTSGKLTIKYNTQTASTINVQLPDDLSSYFKTQNGVAQLQESAVPRITLTLTTPDGKPLDSIGVIKSTQGLLLPGSSTQTTYTLSGNEVTAKEFVEQDSFAIKGGVATILLYPSFHAGDDTLTIEIPGLPVQSIPVSVKPGSAYRLAIQTPENMMPGNTTSGKVLVYDKWDNAINTPTTVSLQSIGDLQFNGMSSGKVTTDENGVASIMLTSSDLGGKQYIYGSIDGIDNASQIQDAQSITVLAPQRKPANLNAMYLLLGGSDRGNRWNYFGQQGNQAEDVLTSSDKTLAVTTMLTHPDRVLSSFIRLNSNAQVYDATDIPLIIKNNELAYDLAEKGYISFGSSRSFSLVQGSGTQKVNDQQLVYTPEQTDSVISSNEVKNNTIIINGEPVWGLDPASPHLAQIVSTNNYDSNRDQIWDVIYQGNLVGTLRLHARVDANGMHLQDSLGVQQTWLGGSTNSPMGRMIYDRDSAPLSAQTARAGGVEESRDTDTNTNWRNTFQAATAFAEGDLVGKATQHGASPFLITLGDPMISRQTNNPTVSGTNYDAGQGKTIFTETEKSISKTVPFDLDKDGQKDLLIVYTDGSVRILKNEGGKDPYQNLGMLMIIADGIKDLFVGDTDGNGYQDIMVQTNSDTLRVYKNTEGKMDVDGRQVCLAIPDGDQNVKNAHEMFVTDMDKDGNIDILTNDTIGNITLFYGGSSSAGDNYVSKNKANCDDQRQTRVDNNKKLIKSYGVSLTDGQKVYDNSLVHWKGLTIPAEVDANNDNEQMTLANQPQFQNLLKGTDSNFSTLNIGNIVNSGLPEIIQYSASPISTLPAYETTLNSDTIAYEPIHILDSSSPVTIYKQYNKRNNEALKNGDQIDVSITIEARQATTITYLDEIRGPWELTQVDDGSIDTWNRGNLPSTATMDWNISNGYTFMLDNVEVKAGQTFTFGYTLTYVAPKLVSISLEDTNTDIYKDIKTYSTDSCIQGYRSFISNRGKTFAESFVDHTKDVTALQQQSEEDVRAAITEVQSKIDTAADTQKPDIQNMPGMDDLLEKWNEGDGFLQNGNINIGFDSPELNKFTEEAQKTVDKVLRGMCQGFKLGKNNGGATSGPPVPFNMAFLSPGTYNIFGCKLMEDKGLPAFFYPGTIYAGPYTVPFPYGQKGAGDGFYWAQGGVYPSMIRIYVSPTLTMGVGVAICFGSYQAGIQMPSPFRHIAGNCIVLAKTFGAKNNNNNNTNTQLTIPQRQYDLAKAGPCNRPTQNPARPATPFMLSTTSSNGSSNGGLPTVIGTNPSSSIPPSGAYGGGLIQFDQEPKAVSVSNPQPGTDQLKGGKALNLQIQGGNVRGLVKCIINKWLDNQIRYIINNLTNLSVNLYLPELSTLFQGFDNLSMDKLGKLYGEVQRQTDTNNNSDQTPSARQKVVQRLFTKAGMKENSNAVSNPFDALSTMFENVPLIKVNTRNINIQIPFVSQEDIVKYKAYLDDRIKRNERVVQDWAMIAQDAAGKCDSYSSPFERNACKEKLSSYANVSVKAGQLMKALKGNINTLEEYRKFPIELNKWLSISQRYLTEVSDTVATFFGSLNHRLQLNSRRFEQYVDAIIMVISAIKTRQVLIDFSVNRKTKCGKCRVDNYDFYSCTLSLLCINLPVLPIPPFRIPNIDIDLSNINVGLDILLPKFNFVPKNIPLPRLPDLPQPPSLDLKVDLNVAIPQIPVLPMPPKLPELPSFIPNIELNLPNLPPAPRIPKIAPQIQATLKVAEFIAKIFCIVKGGIGLVSEKGVKTRIEQMTQRTWAVQPFDSIAITKVQPPLRGFDIHIDTYINLQLNFNAVYDLLNQFAQNINKQTNQVFNQYVTENIATFSEKAGEVGNEAQGVVDQGNVNGINIQGLNWPQRSDLQYDSTEEGMIELRKQIYALQEADDSVERSAKLHTITEFMSTPSDTQGNIEGLNELHNQADQIVDQKKAEISDIQKTIINDYDAFLQSLQTILVSDDTETATLGASLFTANEKVIDTIAAEKMPEESYLELNGKIMDGFANALEKHSAEDLNMSLLTYNETKNYVKETRSAINEGLLLAANVQSDTEINNHAMHDMSSDAGSLQADVSQYVKGIFVKDSNGDMVNINNREDIIDTLQVNQVREDLNRDNEDEIIMWDQQQVWVKYSNPNKEENKTVFTRLYRTPAFDSPRDVANEVSKGGRISVAGSTFKIRDVYTAPHGFAVEGQSYDTLSLSWDNEKSDGYLVQLAEKVNTRHDHLSVIGNGNETNVRYALLLSSETNMDGLFINTELLGAQKRVSDLVNNGTIVEVEYYDPVDEALGLTLHDLSRDWHYVSVAKLSRKSINRSGTLLEKASPWSHQEVGGTQLAADKFGPVPTVTLVRTANGNIEGQGFSLEPIIGNAYSLAVQWTDDAGVKDNTVRFSNGNSQSSAGGKTTVNSLPYRNVNDSLIISARDMNGNSSTHTVNIHWDKAGIEITDIEHPTDVSSIIDTEISEGLDKGNVLFERQRNNTRTLLQGKNAANSLVSLFPLALNQQALSGGVFIRNNTMSLYNKDNKRIGAINKDNGQLSLDDAFKDSIDVQVVFTSNVPTIILKEKETGKALFSIVLKGKTALNTTINDTTKWQPRKLDDGYGQAFTDGTCVADLTKTCKIYISTQGAIWVPNEYKNDFVGRYSFDTSKNAVGIEFIDREGKSVANTSFISQPLP